MQDTINQIRFEKVSNEMLCFVGDCNLVSKDRVLEENLGNGKGIAFIRCTNIDGLFTYGLEQTEDYCLGHGHGYIWASRASVMNKAFDVALIDILYRNEKSNIYSLCAIDYAHLEPLLEDTEYYVKNKPRVDDEDIYYDVKKRG